MAEAAVTRGPGRCPDDQTLAAYIDGTLDAEARAELERHLAECASCREVTVETAIALDADPSSESPVGVDERDPRVEPPTTPANGPNRDAGSTIASPEPSPGAGSMAGPQSGDVLPFRTAGRRWRRWSWAVAGSLAAAALVVLAVVMPRLDSRDARDDGVDALVDAVGARRPFEPRLSGGFRFGPLASVQRSGDAEPSLAPEVRVAALSLVKVHEDAPSVETAVARAAAEAVLGQVDAAIALLEEATRQAPDRATAWNDLAAVRLLRAQQTSDPASATRALEAADRALALSPRFPEAAYNKALALEAAGRDDDARSAWAAYLAIDPDSEWARDVRGGRRR